MPSEQTQLSSHEFFDLKCYAPVLPTCPVHLSAQLCVSPRSEYLLPTLTRTDAKRRDRG